MTPLIGFVMDFAVTTIQSSETNENYVKWWMSSSPVIPFLKVVLRDAREE